MSLLKSVEDILNSYLDKKFAYDIDFIKIVDGDLPDDTYYFCRVADTCYIVVETDYVHTPLTYYLKDIKGAFHDIPLRTKYWLVKKDYQHKIGSKHVALDVDLADETQAYYDALVTRSSSNHSFELAYLLLEVSVSDK